VGLLAADWTVGPTALGNIGGAPTPLPIESLTVAVTLFAPLVVHEVHTAIMLPNVGPDVKLTTHVVPEPLQLCWDWTCVMVPNAGGTSIRMARARSLFIFDLQAVDWSIGR
jgi:hypothetical protein